MRSASAALRNFVRHPKKGFSAPSANSSHVRCTEAAPGHPRERRPATGAFSLSRAAYRHRPSCLAGACTAGTAREPGARRALRWSCRSFWSSMKLGRDSNFPCGQRSCGPTVKLWRVQRAEPPPEAASGSRGYGPCWRGPRC